MNKNFYVCLNGNIIKAGDAKVSVFDHGFLYGDGVYDTMRTYGGKIWQIDVHLKRLEKSAERLDIKFPYSRERIAGLILKLLKKNNFKESRVRISLTRGENGYVFTGAKKPTLLIQATELKPEPRSVYEKGVDVITVNYERIAPEAKTISMLPMVLANQDKQKKKAYEAVFVDKNKNVREGTIANLFIIEKGVLITAKSGVLLGTTRSTILSLAKRAGLKVKIMDFKVPKLYGADEVFITNSTRKIVPVRKVDGKKIGKGRPGPYTKKLMKVFDDYIKEKTG